MRNTWNNHDWRKHDKQTSFSALMFRVLVHHCIREHSHHKTHRKLQDCIYVGIILVILQLTSFMMQVSHSAQLADVDLWRQRYKVELLTASGARWLTDEFVCLLLLSWPRPISMQHSIASIQFKIICIALFTIQSLQSNFTGNYVSKIDLYWRNSI